MQEEVTARRLAAQLLSGSPGADPVAVADRLLAVQAQDLNGARLAVRARTRGLSVVDVDRAFNEGALLISWLNRGTLHLVRAQDYAWLHPLTAPQLASANARRLAQEGVSPEAADRAVAVIRRALRRDGALTRKELKDRIATAGVRTEGQALVHILVLATLRGFIVRGPMVGRDHAFVLVREWLGKSPRVDRPTALAELARRYLAGHGPAGDRDLARWAGLPLGDARAALRSISGEVRERSDGLLEPAGVGEEAPPLPPPRLLGAFDPLLLGWVSREPIVGKHQVLVTDNGLFRPFALVRGRAAATWRIERGRVVLTPFTTLKRADRLALEADAADVKRFLDRSQSTV